MTEPRYMPPIPYTGACEDCGAAVIDQAAHTRFHSILSGHARALAVLKESHIGDRECRIDRPHDATECDGYHLDPSDT